jgi:hypothetical protein
VSEHLCQGDSGDNFNKGNYALWQIWPRVFGPSFFNFPPKRSHMCEFTRVRREEDCCTCDKKGQKQSACVTEKGRNRLHVWYEHGTCVVWTIQTTQMDHMIDVNRPYNIFASSEGFSGNFVEFVNCWEDRFLFSEILYQKILQNINFVSCAWMFSLLSLRFCYNFLS